MTKSIENRVKFDIIRYANCWEDTDLLLEGLNIRSDSKCLSIASAGDNSFSLLTKNPEIVYAVDLSLPQTACAELKKNAIKYLDYSDFLEFLGFCKSESRISLYREIESYLSAEAASYFSKNMAIIKKGLIHCGKFERYFHIFSKFIMPLIHSKKTIHKLLSLTTLEEQKQFYCDKWDNKRFKFLFKIFFSGSVMGLLGRDKEFFKFVDSETVSQKIKSRVDKAFETIPMWSNSYINYILLGNFGNILPHFAKEENFNAIKLNIDKLLIKKGELTTVIKESDVKFDVFNLSDIFEYMDMETFKDIAEKLISAANSGARLAYWNMLADRKISDILPDHTIHLKDLSDELYKKDKAFFYKAFFIDEVC